jgi:hypothetical protein
MADVQPHVIANAIMGKLYDVLTNGDSTVPPSPDNFFSWCTPGIPMDVADLEFLTQGLTGVVKAKDLSQITGASSGSGSSGSSGSGSSGATDGSTPITPELLNTLRASDTAKMYQQAEMLARIVDFIPDLTKLNNQQFVTFSVQNNNGTLSDSYRLLLQFSQVMETVLPDDVKQKIAKFRGLMQSTVQKTDLITGAVTTVTQDSPLVVAYNSAMQNYVSAALDYNSHRVNALAGNDPAAVHDWAINANLYREKVKAAMDEWVSNGYKEDYEAMNAYIQQVQARDLSLLKQEYEQDVENARLTGLASGSDFFYTSLLPGNFASSSGWTGFSFSSGDFTSYSNSSFNNSGWSASAGGSFLGIFGGSGGGSGASGTQQYNGTFSSDSFFLSFEIAQVPISRPWFKDAFLLSRAWRMPSNNPDYANKFVSDGGSPPKGFIPAYPTSVVFIRNLKMTLGHSQGFSNFLSGYSSSSAGGGGFVSLGPFFLGGSASHYSNSGYSRRNWGFNYDGQTMTVPGMQIAGFKCHILPKCPNPDPSITSWV